MAYGTSFSKNIDAGHLQYSVYRSPDAYKAWEASRKVVNDHIDGTAKFDEHALEGALSSIVVSFADDESTMLAAASMSFINQVIHKQSRDYNMELLKKVRAVTVEDLKSVLKEFVLPVFQHETSNTVVVTAPAKADVSSSLLPQSLLRFFCPRRGKKKELTRRPAPMYSQSKLRSKRKSLMLRLTRYRSFKTTTGSSTDSRMGTKKTKRTRRRRTTVIVTMTTKMVAMARTRTVKRTSVNAWMGKVE